MSALFAPPRYSPMSGNGTSYPGAKLYFFVTGTTTPKDTFSDADLDPSHVQAHPVVADSNGLFAAIYLEAGDYSVILKDSSDNVLWSVDPYTGLDAGDTLTTRGDLLTRDATGYKRLGIGTLGQRLTSNGLEPVWTDAPDESLAGVAQTVQGGPVTTAGLPDFLPSTDANFDLGSQNLSANYPLVVAAANGFSSGGPLGRIGYSEANLTWTALTASRAAATPNYLYVLVNADGTLTTGSTVTAPVYQWGGTPATTSGLFTFNISEMKGYLGNGSTAPQTYLVMVGEAATDGSGVISTVAYAYNGRYDSGFTATAPSPSSSTTANHNIGTMPRIRDFILECTTIDGNFAVGEQINLASTQGSEAGTTRLSTLATTRNTIRIVTTTTNSFVALDQTLFGGFVLTVARWKYKFIASRGW